MIEWFDSWRPLLALFVIVAMLIVIILYGSNPLPAGQRKMLDDAMKRIIPEPSIAPAIEVGSVLRVKATGNIGRYVYNPREAEGIFRIQFPVKPFHAVMQEFYLEEIEVVPVRMEDVPYYKNLKNTRKP